MLYDKNIRALLYDFLDEKFIKVRTFEEKIIGKSRSDVVAVTVDAIIGIEIKSDADSYERLPTQIKDYDKFFDMNCVLVGASHAKQVHKHIPNYWGIWSIDESGVIQIIREAERNPKVKPAYQLKLLWKRELYSILGKNSLPKYRDKSAKFIIDKLVEKLPPEKLKEDVCFELFERDYTTLEDVKPRGRVARHAQKSKKAKSRT